MYIEEKLEQYEKALKKLEEVLNLDFNDIVRDSAIQRFEICFELSWKAMKQALEFKGIIPGNSPRNVFQNSFKLDWINDENTWIEILSMRNISTHTYNETLANSLYQKLPGFLSEMKSSLQKIKTDTGL